MRSKHVTRFRCFLFVSPARANSPLVSYSASRRNYFFKPNLYSQSHIRWNIYFVKFWKTAPPASRICTSKCQVVSDKSWQVARHKARGELLFAEQEGRKKWSRQCIKYLKNSLKRKPLNEWQGLDPRVIVGRGWRGAFYFFFHSQQQIINTLLIEYRSM